MTPDEFRANPEIRELFYTRGLDCHVAPMDAEDSVDPRLTIDDIVDVVAIRRWRRGGEVGAVVEVTEGRWAFLRNPGTEGPSTAMVSRDYSCVAHLSGIAFIPDTLDALAFHRDLVLPEAPNWPTNRSGVVIVSGSRALRDRDDAVLWAKGMIRAVFFWLGARIGILVTGDAPGPDTWAREMARGQSVQAYVYGLDGKVHTYAESTGDKIFAPPWGTRTEEFSSRTWPLERNRVMVAKVAERVRQSRDAEGTPARPALLLGLGAPWSDTHGTQHTIRHARAADLPVCEFNYPCTQPWPVIR